MKSDKNNWNENGAKALKFAQVEQFALKALTKQECEWIRLMPDIASSPRRESMIIILLISKNILPVI
ncbi:MAG: hypothetical protein ACP5JO_06855 [Candidatus Ratteibacteria bacterium]